MDLVQWYSPVDRPSWSANRLSPNEFTIGFLWILDASLVNDVVAQRLPVSGKIVSYGGAPLD